MKGATFIVFIALLAAAGIGWGIEAPDVAENRVATGAWWANAQEACPSCSVFTTRPFMSPSLDEETKTVSVSMGVMNASGVSPVVGATIFVSVYDSGMSEIESCRAFTDERGNANFSYAGLACEGGCTVRMIFCCSNPGEMACVLSPCLGKPWVRGYSDVRACEGYGGAWPGEATVNGESVQLYPTADKVVVPPQPAAGFSFTFTFCFPLLVIFGFLLAAMYASGRDPFAMFSFYAPRYTRGAERPMGGKGASVSAGSMAMALQSLVGLGSDINAMRKGEKLTGPISQIIKEKKQYGELWERKMAVRERATGRQETRGQAISAAERAKERAIAGPSGGIASVVGQVLLGAPVEMPSAEGTGMGFGATMMSVLGLILRYSAAPWLTAPLAEAAEGLAREWIRERQAEFGEKVVPALLNGMSVERDAEGNATRIEVDYVDPRTGERVQRTVESREACAEFIEKNITEPLSIYMQNNAERGVQTARRANEIIAGQNPVSGARDILRAEGSREGGPTGEVLAALQVLSDANSSDSARRSAFKTIASSNLDNDVKINALIAATEGMDYRDLAQFARTAPAASVIELIKNIDGNTLLSSNYGGNLLAAISVAAARLDAINGMRAEGQADTLGLGEIVANARAAISECGGKTFEYREGAKDAAEKMVAMGLSAAALGLAASVERVNLDLLSPETKEEIVGLQAESGAENVNVAKLSARAREEISQYLQSEAMSALFDAYGSRPTEQQREEFYNGTSPEAVAYREFVAVIGRYEDSTATSVGIMERAARPGIEASDHIMSQTTPIIGQNGELLAIAMPRQWVGGGAIAALEQHGVDPDLAGAISGLRANEAERRAAEAMVELADRLTADPVAYAEKNQHNTIMNYRYKAATALISDPSEANAAEYARSINDDSIVPGLAERRESAHAAVEALSTSADPAARAEAERTLRNLGVREGTIDAVLSPAAHGIRPETSISNLNAEVDRVLDEKRGMEVDVDVARRNALNYIVYAPENPFSMENPQGLAEARENMQKMLQQAAEERQRNVNFQVAVQQGDEGLRRFYENLGQHRRLAEEAERIARESTTQTELGMPVWRGPSTGGTSEQPPR